MNESQKATLLKLLSESAGSGVSTVEPPAEPQPAYKEDEILASLQQEIPQISSIEKLKKKLKRIIRRENISQVKKLSDLPYLYLLAAQRYGDPYSVSFDSQLFKLDANDLSLAEKLLELYPHFKESLTDLKQIIERFRQPVDNFLGTDDPLSQVLELNIHLTEGEPFNPFLAEILGKDPTILVGPKPFEDEDLRIAKILKRNSFDKMIEQQHQPDSDSLPILNLVVPQDYQLGFEEVETIRQALEDKADLEGGLALKLVVVRYEVANKPDDTEGRILTQLVTTEDSSVLSKKMEIFFPAMSDENFFAFHFPQLRKFSKPKLLAALGRDLNIWQEIERTYQSILSREESNMPESLDDPDFVLAVIKRRLSVQEINVQFGSNFIRTLEAMVAATVDGKVPFDWYERLGDVEVANNEYATSFEKILGKLFNHRKLDPVLFKLVKFRINLMS